MTNTTFYPATKPSAHPAVAYTRNRTTGALLAAAPPTAYGAESRQQGNGGLYSTGPD